MLFIESQSSAGETNSTFYPVIYLVRKISHEFRVGERGHNALFVSHQNQAVNSAQTYLSALLHCLPGEEKEEEEKKEKKKTKKKKK